MSVLVDTSIWSLAFRRRRATLNKVEQAAVSELEQLVIDHLAQLIGPIRQEILTGIREASQFLGLKDDLREYRDEPLLVDDFETAAAISNRCRAAGIAGSPTDFLICAVASNRKWAVYSADRDFTRYALHAEIQMYRPREGER